MSRRLLSNALLILAVVFVAVTASSQNLTTRTKTMHAKGTFNVTMGKADVTEIGQSANIGRMTIDKVWSGAIEGTSKGEMLSSGEANGAMVYVALEKMTVAVNGKSGTFIFRHGATMMTSDPSSATLDVTVVPQSGTGDLTGIEGKLTIIVDKSGHTYDFAYTLPGS
jgi:hypothetical protein